MIQRGWPDGGNERLPAALAFLNRGSLCIEHRLSIQTAHKCSRPCTKKLGTKTSCSENTRENRSLFLGEPTETPESALRNIQKKLDTYALCPKFSNLVAAELHY